MSLPQQVAPEAAHPTPGVLPPVLLYVPAIAESASNTAYRVANAIAIKATQGRGTFAAEAVASPSAELTDGRRVVRTEGGPVLDVYLVDYRPRLKLTDVSGDDAGATLRRFGRALAYFIRALVLVLAAQRRAKSPIAKVQLLMGLGAVAVLYLSVIFTALAVLASLGLWTDRIVSGTAADAIALGATAFTTWVFFNVRPTVARASNLLQQLLDYALYERHAASVAGALTSAIDSLLEDDPKREIHLVGYSLGSLVAIDFLYPRSSLSQELDDRHAEAISSLTTIGCPLDFVRLFVPGYADDREARIPNLRWTNVYIAADIFGSNFLDGDDVTELPDADPDEAHPGAVRIAGHRPDSKRYTSERLTVFNILSGRGFLRHGGYWDEPDRENCLHLVIRQVMPS